MGNVILNRFFETKKYVAFFLVNIVFKQVVSLAIKKHTRFTGIVLCTLDNQPRQKCHEHSAQNQDQNEDDSRIHVLQITYLTIPCCNTKKYIKTLRHIHIRSFAKWISKKQHLTLAARCQ